MPTQTGSYDPAEFLRTRKAQAAYLAAALEDGHPEVIRRAVAAISRARGMAEVAQAAKVGRTSLYKALGAGGNPSFGLMINVISALGFGLGAKPTSPLRAASAKKAPPASRVEAERSQNAKRRARSAKAMVVLKRTSLPQA
jgi:probable addiction module antidote protein